jgi:hypothetical protein
VNTASVVAPILARGTISKRLAGVIRGLVRNGYAGGRRTREAITPEEEDEPCGREVDVYMSLPQGSKDSVRFLW